MNKIFEDESKNKIYYELGNFTKECISDECLFKKKDKNSTFLYLFNKC